MDEKKSTPENNNVDEFDEVLEIMKKRRTKAETNEKVQSAPKNEEMPSQDTKDNTFHLTGALSDTVIIPASATDSIQSKKPDASISETAQEEHIRTDIPDTVNKSSVFATVLGSNNGKTVEVDASLISKISNNENDATRVDIDKVKEIKSNETGDEMREYNKDKPISLDDFNKTNSTSAVKGKKNKVKVTFLGSVWFGIIKIILYLAFILAISSAIAATVIFVGNDVFAFVKESEITAKIPAGASSSDIAVILEENNIMSDIGETELTVDILKNNAVKLSDVLNTTSVLQPLKDVGITKIQIIDNTCFTISVPKDSDIAVIAELLDTVDAIKVTTDLQILVNIPEGATTKEVGKILKKAGIIEYSGVFNSYAKYRISKRSYLTGEYIPGDHILNPMMNYDKLLDTLSAYERDVSGTVRITIPEGLTVNETLDLLVSKGVGKKEAYTEALQNFEYEYKFAEGLTKEELSKHRFDTNISYRLEGYLFPDTYDFYLNENPVSALDKFLSNFNRKFEEEYYERAKELGMTVDEIITLASMIEKEGNNPADYYYISSVFHNRLKSSEYPYLNSDATLQYAQDERSGLYDLDTNMDHPYNTYKKPGLPPGPICNPGIQAIDAALYPERTGYYYFYTKKNGETVFTRTYAEHQRVVNSDKSN